ncbi:MAG: carbohydrate kinase [Thermoproteus sp. AZ2]|uniref:Carbohydrate kinase n=1 Tax=Thermoproteus sp. AZ2 TaxID=1609232 RepID=A0ACC6V053_9CREN|nr:MAG: carbohydrate kinase [Thermoproteus sp. AZ2]
MYAYIVGNPTVDLIITNLGVAKRVGGPPYYMGMALAALGIRPIALGVVGSEEAELVSRELSKIGVEPRLKIGDATAYFELDYRQRPRRAKALRRPTTKIDGVVEGPLVLIAPVYDEVGRLEFAADLSAVDLQGFIRAGLEAPNADVAHFSDDDMAVELGELPRLNKKWRIVLYTRGIGGAYMAYDGVIYYADSARINAEDVTGSGDVFLAVFATIMLRRGDPEAALCEASSYTAGFLARGRVERLEYGCVARKI